MRGTQYGAVDRLQQLTRFWNHLPALRAVAEVRHLPTAAEALGVTPSAISRSVKQAEEGLGCELFRRSNRRLEPTRECLELLDALRESMRRIEEATRSLRGETLNGALRIASTGVATYLWVMPALVALQQEHPELRPTIGTNCSELDRRLTCGELDVAFTSHAISFPGVEASRLGKVSASIYCGPEHPLRHAPPERLEGYADQWFVAPPSDPMGLPTDGWPSGVPRQVVLEVDRMQLGYEALLQGPYLAVLPDPIAERVGKGQIASRRLHRLPCRELAPTPVFGITRSSIGMDTAATRVLERVRQLCCPDG